MLKSFGYDSYVMSSLEKKVEKLYNQIDVYATSDLCMEQIAHHSLGIHLYIMPGGSKSVILNGAAYLMTSTEGRCVAIRRWMPHALAFCAIRQMLSSTSFGATIIKSASSSITTTK